MIRFRKKKKLKEEEVERFKEFLRQIALLNPIEFIGVLHLLGVNLFQKDLSQEELKKLSPEELSQLKYRPYDELISDLMDAYLNMGKKKKRQIERILREAENERLQEGLEVSSLRDRKTGSDD